MRSRPSRILHIEAEPWEPDPVELEARDRDRSSRLAEWKRAFNTVPERQAESNSTCSTKFPASSVEDLTEDISRGGSKQWCDSSSLECHAPATSSSSTTRGPSFREVCDPISAGLSFEYIPPSENNSGRQQLASTVSSAKTLGQARNARTISTSRSERSFSDPARPTSPTRCRSARSQTDLHRSDGVTMHGGSLRARSMGRRSSSAFSLQSVDPEAERSFEKYVSTPVLDRLCDSRYYTGSQRKRFDEGYSHDKFGKIADDFGQLAVQGYRPRSSTSPQRSRRKSTRTPSPMVLADASDLAPLKVILVFRNADQFHDGERVVIHRHIRTLTALYKRLTEILKPICPISELYNAEFVRIGRIDEMEHGEKYLACEGQGPTSKRHLLTKFLTALTQIH